ncbi:MAG: inositol monophosphatase family protein [Aestuariivita sp.]|nr:inositol monophosphatase family protein [Aestuariivita sp.]MCY4201881.1 inositol monophosphatase family protein [Aestuariivita sp.]MCY4288255.1 inositol monophosphatase family protein [Aestuariivita sp.]MCY4347154.1 inositol monophosphatase family protein [Aestuariivita sp.]
MVTTTLSDIELAHKMANAAGKVITPHFRTEIEYDNKDTAAGFDPVSEADRAAERTMRDIVDQFRHKDGFCGEEFADKVGSSGRVWVVDPIDGTRGFMCGTPTWGTLIALRSKSERVCLGLIDQPYIGERFWGTDGQAYFQNRNSKKKIFTSRILDLSAAKLFSTFPEIGRTHDRSGFKAVAHKVQLVRFGMDCYAYALLAAGYIELIIEAGLRPYDINAPIGLIEAAGGIVTNWSGQNAVNGGQVLAAANQSLHLAALDLLKDYAD